MTKYSQVEKTRFWEILKNYKNAMETGSQHEIILTSIAIHAQLGRVPNSYKKYVNKTFNEIKREIPL